MTVLNINLIALRRKQKQRAAARTRLGVYSLFALAVCVVMLYFVMDMKVQLVQAAIIQVQEQLNAPDLAKKKARVTYLEGRMKEMTPSVQLLERVHSSESQWIRIISDIGACTPPDTLWLTQMTSERSDKSQTISFRGSALEEKDVGRFMLALGEHQEWCGQPKLSFTQSRQAIGGDGQVIEFEVAVPLRAVVGSDLK